MSKCIFNNEDYGRYYFFTQLIELNNDKLSVDAVRAMEILTAKSTESFTPKEIEFYKTFIHESVHFLDSTSTLWGIEYSIRLFNCLKSENNSKCLEVFALNDSEIEQHSDLNRETESDHFTYREMRAILSYDKDHGVHIQFKYHDYNGGAFRLVHSTPLSMLAVIEGHAFSQEQLIALEIYESRMDCVSLGLLEKKYKTKLEEINTTEYTCVLAFVEQIFSELEFKKKLKIVIYACELVLNMPTLMSTFPEGIIDGLFRNSDPLLISSLKMEFGRGMNRSSLLCLMLIVLQFSFEKDPIDEQGNFESQLEDRLFSVFLYEGQDLSRWKEQFFMMWEMEYDHGCQLLAEKEIELARLSAVGNKNKSWHNFNISNVLLPSIALSTGEFVCSENNIDYDMEKHYYEYSDNADNLQRLLEQRKGKKPHLRPYVYHDWLERIKRGDTGTKFYPE
ncbi:MAG: hypothetical protein HRT51_06700 [Colwellia sp.]|nr:hypothetical protein [Colwellia sp.]